MVKPKTNSQVPNQDYSRSGPRPISKAGIGPKQTPYNPTGQVFMYDLIFLMQLG